MIYSKPPWKWTRETPGSRSRTMRDADSKALMCDEQYYPWCPDSDADWNLISAAPELLEAIRSLLILPQVDGTHAANRAKEVIAKAEGR